MPSILTKKERAEIIEDNDGKWVFDDCLVKPYWYTIGHNVQVDGRIQAQLNPITEAFVQEISLPDGSHIFAQWVSEKSMRGEGALGVHEPFNSRKFTV